MGNYRAKDVFKAKSLIRKALPIYTHTNYVLCAHLLI